MSEISRERCDEVAGAIVRYLAEHPDAADTDQGIAEWWLPTMGIDVTTDEVQRSLHLLQELGVVEAQPCAGGSVIYRAAGRRGSFDR